MGKALSNFSWIVVKSLMEHNAKRQYLKGYANTRILSNSDGSELTLRHYGAPILQYYWGEKNNVCYNYVRILAHNAGSLTDMRRLNQFNPYTVKHVKGNTHLCDHADKPLLLDFSDAEIRVDDRYSYPSEIKYRISKIDAPLFLRLRGIKKMFEPSNESLSELMVLCDASNEKEPFTKKEQLQLKKLPLYFAQLKALGEGTRLL